MGKPIFQGRSSMYDGILYPSVKDKDRCMLNVAFTQHFIDKYAKLTTVVKGIVNEDLESVNMQEIGFCHDTKITWYRPTVLRNTIKLTNCFYVDKQNKEHNVCEGKIFDKSHKEIKDNYAVFFADFDQWIEKTLSIVSDKAGYVEDIKDESFEKSIKDAIIVRDLTDWTLEKGHCVINIVKVICYFDFQITLKRV